MSKIHPDAILPDLSKPDSLVKFTKDDITFVYGSKWKQRYFHQERPFSKNPRVSATIRRSPARQSLS